MTSPTISSPQVCKETGSSNASLAAQGTTALLQPGSEPAGQARGFYVMSLKWTSGDHITWWGPDNSGYTTDLSRAGIYTATQIAEAPDYYDSGRRDDGTLAVPVEAATRFVKTYRPVPNLRSTYKALRAARNRARRPAKALGAAAASPSGETVPGPGKPNPDESAA